MYVLKFAIYESNKKYKLQRSKSLLYLFMLYIIQEIIKLEWKILKMI